MLEKCKAFSSWHRDYRNQQKRDHYRDMRRQVQQKVRGMKNDWWIRKSEELQRLADMNNSKEFFAATRKIYGPPSGGASRDESIIHREKGEIKDR